MRVSGFAQGELGEDGYGSAFASLRFCFSEDDDKSHIRRHREDDLDIVLPQLLLRDGEDCVATFFDDDEGVALSGSCVGHVGPKTNAQ